MLEKSTTFAMFVFAIIELNPADFVDGLVYVKFDVKLDVMCGCFSVEFLPNVCGCEKNKPEIISSCVYHLMYASNFVLVCGQHNFCYLSDTCNIRTKE